jgi:hypothetical protein
MKNITKFLIALMGILVISCTTNDVQDRPVIKGIDAPVLSAPNSGSAYVLLPVTMTQQAERFVWTSANYGGNVVVTYTLQIDKVGGDFSKAQVIGGANNANQASITQQALNVACLALGATPYVPANFIVRVGSSASGYAPMFSAALPIAITPYTTATPHLWLPGSYQTDSGYGSTWSQATAPQLASTGYGNADFEGYVYFKNNVVADSDNGFKFSTQANWNGTNYGGAAGVLSTSGGNVGASAGYYKVNANTTTLTYSLTATQWGIAGNATTNGWDGMIPMTYNPVAKTWSIVATLSTQAATSNGLKFKANGSWDINLGDSGNDGVLEYGGDNIGTTAGTYLITLDLSSPRHYTYSLVKQ